MITITENWAIFIISTIVVCVGFAFRYILVTISELRDLIDNHVPRETFNDLKQDVKDISEKVTEIAKTQEGHNKRMDFQEQILKDIKMDIKNLKPHTAYQQSYLQYP